MVSMVVVLLSLGQTAASEAVTAVALSGRRSGTEAYARRVVVLLVDELKKAGVASVLDDAQANALLKPDEPRACQGAAPCLKRLAGHLGRDAVLIGVDVGKVQNQLFIHVEAVDAASVEEVSVGTDFSVQLEEGDVAFARPIGDFVGQFVRKQRQRVAAQVAGDVPPAGAGPRLTPTHAELREAPAATSGSLVGYRPAAWVLGGTAGVATGVALAFLVMGLNERSTLDFYRYQTAEGQAASRLPYADVQSRTASGNRDFTVSLISGVVGSVLAAGAAYLFVASEPGEFPDAANRATH